MNRSWWLECKFSGAGAEFQGDFPAAVYAAWGRCTSDLSCWTVWELPRNRKVAEVTLRGATWTHEDYRHWAWEQEEERRAKSIADGQVAHLLGE